MAPFIPPHDALDPRLISRSATTLRPHSFHHKIPPPPSPSSYLQACEAHKQGIRPQTSFQSTASFGVAGDRRKRPLSASSSICVPFIKALKDGPIQLPQQGLFCTPFEVAYSEAARQRNLRKLTALFTEADADHSGCLDLNEFRNALRQPGFQRAFSDLGVQPHQSELVFRSMCQQAKACEELTITGFMGGLTKLVGADVDGTGRELDVKLLRPTREATWLRQQGLMEAEAEHENRRKVDANSPSKGGSSRMTRGVSQTDQRLGAHHLLPEAKVQRAFVHSASAMALASAHSVVASKILKKGLPTLGAPILC